MCATVSSRPSPRIALCQEWITTYSGSEQVARRIAAALNIEDIFSFVADPALAETFFPGRRVSVSRWNRHPFALSHWQYLLPAMPGYWKRVDLRSYDVVITSSHALVNSIRVPPGARHICYCHTPIRYGWNWRTELGRIPAPLRPAWPGIAAMLRRVDSRNARRVDRFIANSRNVARRIARNYGRDADVIYPPIDVDYWTPGDTDRREDYFLYAGRFVAYKRPEIAIRAAQKAGVRLVLAGGGPDEAALRRLAGPETSFVLSPSNDELRELYRNARALVYPGVEDFGMTLVEAQACGTPVIARAEGGALEAVVDGRTGLLYEPMGPPEEALAAALGRFDPADYDRADLRGHAESFRAEAFDAAIRAVLAEELSLH